MAKKFEDDLEKLEEIVETLEEGGAGLEESLKAFEAGVKLSKSCHKQLVEAQKRVEILVQDENANDTKEPFKG